MGFKICVVGCGWMAENGHGPSYVKYNKLNPDVVLSGCCDLNPNRSAIFADKFGFKRSYTDYEEMLRIEKPDAVCLISSENATKNLAIGIIKTGCPLMLEKPPGLNAEEATEIAEAAKAYRVPVKVAFNRRYMPLLVYLKDELIKSDEPVQNITYMFIRKDRKDLDFSTTAIHGIDAAKYLAGSDYDDIQFVYQPVPSCGENVANIYMQCEFKSGATGQLIFMPMGGGVIERAIVNLTSCTYFLELPVWNAIDSPGKLQKIKDNKILHTISGDDLNCGTEMFETNGFYAENEIFFDSLRSGKTVVSDIESGIQSVDIANYIRNRSMKYNKG